MKRLFAPFKGSLPGFLAQGFTLASALYPVVIGREDVLVYLLTVAAPVTIVINAVSLGAQTRIPMARQHERLGRLAASLSGVLISCSGLSAAFMCLTLLSADSSLLRFVVGLQLLLPCQALYSIALALGTAELSYSKLMFARLLYGSVTFVGTLVVGIVHASPLGFLVANALGYLCGAIPTVVGKYSWSLMRRVCMATLSFYGFKTELMAARYVIAASLVSGFGGQIGALATPLVPAAYAGAWATSIRIMTGLQTVGGQILGPKIDIGFLTGLRENDSRVVSRIWRRGLVIGSVIGAACALTSAAGIGYVATTPMYFLIPASMILYTVTSVFLAPIDRSLTLLGGQRERLVWDVIRGVVGLALVFYIRGNLLLVALAVSGLFSMLSYLYLVHRRVINSIWVNETAQSELEQLSKPTRGAVPTAQ